MSALISASVVLSDQYLSSQAVISNRDQIDLMAIMLLFTCCLFLRCFLSLCLTLIIHRYVSYTSNYITALGPYSGRSHRLSVNAGDIHNYIIERESMCVERLAQLHHD